jgi:CheY-like chemotaxis protein
MSRVLLIENDSSFAADLARVLTRAGYETQVVGEGREGLAAASGWRPQAIVLCVELPDMSGYLVCQRLKKDEALRDVPLILTSADATEKSFADHQKLKVRADDYLLKPYVPDALLEILARRVGVPEGASSDEEELVRFEDGMGDGGALPALDLGSFGDDKADRGMPLEDRVPTPAPPARDEDDLLLDGLTGVGDERPTVLPPARDDDADEAPAAGGLELEIDSRLVDRPVGAEELDAAADSLPDVSRDPSLGARGGPAGDDEALGAFPADDRTDAEPLRPVPEPRVRPASADLLRAAGINVLAEEGEPPRPAPGTPQIVRPPAPAPGTTRVMPALKLPRPAAPPGPTGEPLPTPAPLPVPAGGGQAARLERELAEVRERLADARSEVLSRESEVRQLRDKVGALTRRAEQAEAQVREARTEAGEAGELRARLEAAERRAADAAGARAEAEKRSAETERRAAEAVDRAEAAQTDARKRADEEAEKRLGALRAELESARADADAAREQLEEARAQGAGGRAAAALERRLAELEASNAKNEERVLKAYQKIRGDEKVRDKVRKALAIASQLLDEGMAPDPAGDKDRRVAIPGPREPQS